MVVREFVHSWNYYERRKICISRLSEPKVLGRWESLNGTTLKAHVTTDVFQLSFSIAAEHKHSFLAILDTNMTQKSIFSSFLTFFLFGFE